MRPDPVQTPLVEVLVALGFDQRQQIVDVEDLHAEQRDVANLIARTFVDHEGDVDPLPVGIGFQFAADAGAEEAQAAVVFDQPFDVAVDLLAVEIAADQPEQGWRFGSASSSAGQWRWCCREVDPPDPLLVAFVDQVNHAAIAGLVAFQHCANAAVALRA